MQRVTLWTKDFTIITLGTVISAIGGAAMSFALSLVVFDNTASTWLSGIFAAITLFPSVLLPILAAPYVDRHSRKRIIVALDACSGVLYLLFAGYLFCHTFSYGIYLLFGVLTSSIGVVYSQAYNSLYPDLIPEGFAQKGYSVSSVIYPTVTTLITPIAAIIYQEWGMAVILFVEGILLLLAAFFESFLTTDRIDRPIQMRQGFRGYFEEMLGGLHYLKQEKGVRSIYTYMAITNANSSGNTLMTMAYFQSNSLLGTAKYSLLLSAEMIGRMVGGVLHYFLKIPPEKRYAITEKVYLIYETLDGVMLLLAYPLMLVVRFLCGFLGVNSATLRESAVQKYLPPDIRARVGALFSVLIAVAQMLVRLAVGAVGEVLSYWLVNLVIGGIGIAAVFLIVIRHRREIAAIYNEPAAR